MNSEIKHTSDQLKLAANFGTSSRLKRTLRRPYKMTAPIIMRKLGMSRDIVMDTFWGGKMTGTIPEAVSSVIWRSGYFEYGISQTLLETLKPGSVFVDVGAHFGFFSLLANWLVGEEGKVISVEAMPTTYERLIHNLNTHGASNNHTAVNVAAFNEQTELTFQDYGLVWSSLNSAFGVRNDNETISTAKEVKVKAYPLDDILAPYDLSKIDLIKIDAESSEIFVLRGMNKILKNHNPDIIVEIGDMEGATGGASKEIVSLLTSHGYHPYRRRNGKLEVVKIQDSYSYDNFVFKRND